MLRPALRVVIWSSSALTVFALLTQSMFWWQARVWMMYPLRYPRLPSLLPFAVIGPMAYLLSVANRRTIIRSVR
jgi:hypothetical protein